MRKLQLLQHQKNKETSAMGMVDRSGAHSGVCFGEAAPQHADLGRGQLRADLKVRQGHANSYHLSHGISDKASTLHGGDHLEFV